MKPRVLCLLTLVHLLSECAVEYVSYMCNTTGVKFGLVASTLEGSLLIFFLVISFLLEVTTLVSSCETSALVIFPRLLSSEAC